MGFFRYLLWVICLSLSVVFQAQASPPYDTFEQKLAKLEAEHGGRLGVAMLRTRDGTWYSHRGNERFPMCSVFQVVAVGNLLQLSQSDDTLLDTVLEVKEEEIMPFSYAIEKYKETGITLREMARVCLSVSDNTAANMLVQYLGGPAAITNYTRTLGDEYFRLDRLNMALNDAVPGDERDTTTPLAMAQLLNKLVLGDVLLPPQRDILRNWMRNCRTGDRRLFAGTPRSWTVAQKTGTGDYGTTNAMGVLWPPVGTPLVLAVFYTCAEFDANANSEIIAEVARLATQP